MFKININIDLPSILFLQNILVYSRLNQNNWPEAFYCLWRDMWCSCCQAHHNCPLTGGYYPLTGSYCPLTGGYHPLTGGYYPMTGSYYPRTGSYHPLTCSYCYNLRCTTGIAVTNDRSIWTLYPLNMTSLSQQPLKSTKLSFRTLNAWLVINALDKQHKVCALQ